MVFWIINFTLSNFQQILCICLVKLLSNKKKSIKNTLTQLSLTSKLIMYGWFAISPYHLEFTVQVSFSDIINFKFQIFDNHSHIFNLLTWYILTDITWNLHCEFPFPNMLILILELQRQPPEVLYKLQALGLQLY